MAGRSKKQEVQIESDLLSTSEVACKMRDASRRRKAIRMARALARSILVSLPDDERDAFMVRLRSGENRKQTIIDALNRVRELAEASK